MTIGWLRLLPLAMALGLFIIMLVFLFGSVSVVRCCVCKMEVAMAQVVYGVRDIVEFWLYQREALCRQAKALFSYCH